MRYIANNVECLSDIARQLLDLLKDQPLWLFAGAMGSGKTTLIRALCNVLEVREQISSPTFTLLHSYTTSHHFPVHHADLYRLNTADELFPMDIEHHIYGPGYCFVEWADRFPDYWPQPQSWIYIQHQVGDARHISIHSSCPQQLHTL